MKERKTVEEMPLMDVLDESRKHPEYLHEAKELLAEVCEWLLVCHAVEWILFHFFSGSESIQQSAGFIHEERTQCPHGRTQEHCERHYKGRRLSAEEIDPYLIYELILHAFLSI